MKRVVLADTRSAFLESIRNRILITEAPIDVVDVVTEENAIAEKVQKNKPDELIISAVLVRPGMDFHYPGTKVIAYATNEEDLESIRKAGLNCFGIVRKPADLITKIEKGELLFEEEDRAQILNQGMLEEMKQEPKKAETAPVPQAPVQTAPVEAKRPIPTEAPAVPRFDPKTGKPLTEAVPPRPEAVAQAPAAKAPVPVPESQQEKPTPPARMTKGEMLREAERQKAEKEREELEKEVEESMKAPKKRKTKVVTVFSPKGGVGKTTISGELAEYLSLINDGRGRYRVCLMDYNIDFGNVLDRFMLDPNGVLMTHWAAEIQEKMDAGQDPDKMEYTKEEIERFLQKRPESDLYVLVAPSVHSDSMEITKYALETILRNIINNGGFDFVVIDTGNNTRDAAYYPLCYADEILLIATQDVSTANSIESFLQTANLLPEIDTKKISLVINDIFPEKDTMISVQEVEEVFGEYKTVAKIRHNTDVIKAGNKGILLTDNSRHPFTKEMRKLILHITKQEEVEVEVDSGLTGILKRLLGKK